VIPGCSDFKIVHSVSTIEVDEVVEMTKDKEGVLKALSKPRSSNWIGRLNHLLSGISSEPDCIDRPC
jgi:hypothetical protein